MAMIFPYGETEIEYLKAHDKRLGEAIDRIGYLQRPVNPDLFESLIHSIISQQIAGKALQTIWGRMKAAVPIVTPQSVEALSPEELCAFGLPMRKAEYIRCAARSVLNGTLDLDALRALPDAEVCRRLSELRGIGVWTAEMLMIFSMLRPDVLSYGDLAIHRGMRMLYHHRTIDRALFERYRRRYSPCASVASLYLWAIAGGAIEGMRDYAPASAKKPARAKQKTKS